MESTIHGANSYVEWKPNRKHVPSWMQLEERDDLAHSRREATGVENTSKRYKMGNILRSTLSFDIRRIDIASIDIRPIATDYEDDEVIQGGYDMHVNERELQELRRFILDTLLQTSIKRNIRYTRKGKMRQVRITSPADTRGRFAFIHGIFLTMQLTTYIHVDDQVSGEWSRTITYPHHVCWRGTFYRDGIPVASIQAVNVGAQPSE